MNTCKLFFGNAYISLPNTFLYTGIVSGIILFTVVAALNCYTMLTLIYVSNKYKKIPSYSELSRRIYGWKGKLIVDVAIWCM
jgi:amino acid permease